MIMVIRTNNWKDLERPGELEQTELAHMQALSVQATRSILLSDNELLPRVLVYVS